MSTVLRLVADAMAVLLMVAIALAAWVVVQLGGGGALLACLLAFPGCALMAVAIHYVQQRTRRRRPTYQPNRHSGDRRDAAQIVYCEQL